MGCCEGKMGLIPDGSDSHRAVRTVHKIGKLIPRLFQIRVLTQCQFKILCPIVTDGAHITAKSLLKLDTFGINLEMQMHKADLLFYFDIG
jgi:hypothetical protein